MNCYKEAAVMESRRQVYQEIQYAERQAAGRRGRHACRCMGRPEIQRGQAAMPGMNPPVAPR